MRELAIVPVSQAKMEIAQVDPSPNRERMGMTTDKMHGDEVDKDGEGGDSGGSEGSYAAGTGEGMVVQWQGPLSWHDEIEVSQDDLGPMRTPSSAAQCSPHRRVGKWTSTEVSVRLRWVGPIAPQKSEEYSVTQSCEPAEAQPPLPSAAPM